MLCNCSDGHRWCSATVSDRSCNGLGSISALQKHRELPVALEIQLEFNKQKIRNLNSFIPFPAPCPPIEKLKRTHNCQTVLATQLPLPPGHPTL